ncbi:MAG: hypothetical protein K0A93_11050 [Desulfuromonadaceae bacterium]|nr:hypothetical protein [Desulfuromonadaceae bacterium]
MSETKSAGDIIDARCTKCKDITNHTIVALVEAKVERVKCNVCSGEHKYRGVPRQKSTGTTVKGTTSRRKDPVADERDEWETLQVKIENADSQPYAMDGVFRRKDVIRHKIFGLGQVVAIAGPKKIEVLFQDGKKLLRCG